MELRDYLLATWHAATRPAADELGLDHAPGVRTAWLGLEVESHRGTGEDTLLTAATKDMEGVNILRFDDYASISQAMLSGQIDAMGGGDYGEMYLKKSVKGDDFEIKFPLKTFYFGIGVRKDNPQLLQWLNTFVFLARQDGTLEALSQKYRKMPLPALPTF